MGKVYSAHAFAGLGCLNMICLRWHAVLVAEETTSCLLIACFEGSLE